MVSNKINPVVVIPVYKEVINWTPSELAAMQQVCKVLYKHPIYLIGPEKLNWEPIKEFIDCKFSKKVQVAIFDNKYFADIPGYNKILKSLFFYEYFSSYSHFLLYQLDAYVFEDKLIEWCNTEFDYIGAPWLDGLTDNNSTTLIGVGNGGFSLHNIHSAIKVLRSVKTILRIIEATERTFLYHKIPNLKWITRYVLLKLIFKIKNQRYILNLSFKDEIYEDIFWGRYVPTTFESFKVAPVEDALKFSFEVNPRYLYQLNNEELPFGCHAWEKYDPEFWSNFIKMEENTMYN